MTLELHAACTHDSMEALPLSTVTFFHLSHFKIHVQGYSSWSDFSLFCAVGIRIDCSTQLVSCDIVGIEDILHAYAQYDFLGTAR